MLLKVGTTTAAFVSVACLAFALGWFMRGDLIYSGMFQHTVSLMPSVK